MCRRRNDVGRKNRRPPPPPAAPSVATSKPPLYCHSKPRGRCKRLTCFPVSILFLQPFVTLTAANGEFMALRCQGSPRVERPEAGKTRPCRMKARGRFDNATSRRRGTTAMLWPPEKEPTCIFRQVNIPAFFSSHLPDLPISCSHVNIVLVCGLLIFGRNNNHHHLRHCCRRSPEPAPPLTTTGHLFWGGSGWCFLIIVFLNLFKGKWINQNQNSRNVKPKTNHNLKL